MRLPTWLPNHLTLKQAQMPSRACVHLSQLLAFHHRQCRHPHTHTPLNNKYNHLLPDPLFFFASTRVRALVERIGLLFHRISQFHRAHGSSSTLSVGSENTSSALHHPHIHRLLRHTLAAGTPVVVKINDTMSSIICTLYVVLTANAKHSLWELCK